MPLTPEQIQQACRLIAKSRYDSVMMEAEQLAYTLMGIKAALEHEGGFELTISVIDARLLSWWKCKNRETEIHPGKADPDISPLRNLGKDPDLSPA